MNWNELVWVDRGPHTDDSLGPTDHEPGLAELMWNLLPERGVFCDIGAHVGRYAIRLASKASKVYAVEAQASTAEVLTENILANGVTNVEVICAALWSEETPVTLFDPLGQTDGGSTRVLPSAGGEMMASRLDDVIGDRVDLVKIDVEGAEGHVLAGGRALLDRWHPALVIEMHDRLYGPLVKTRVIEELSALGYEWEVGYEYEGAWYLLAQIAIDRD